MPPASLREKVLAPAGLCALAAVYFLYTPHADYVVDDWLHFRFYSRQPGGSLAAHLGALRDLAENRMYGVFQFDFLSRWIHYTLARAFGYSPGVAFGVEVLAHTGGAWCFYLLLAKLGLGRRLAWLAAAALVLLPSSHGALFWAVNCAFFVWPIAWLPLYLLAFRRVLEAKAVKAGPGALAAGLLLLVVFSGSPAIGLALGAPLWMALCFDQRPRWRRAFGLAAASWIVAGGTLLAYWGYLQARRRSDSAIGSVAESRYEFSYDYFRINLIWTGLHLAHLNGLQDSYYDLRRSQAAAAAGAAAAIVAGVVLAGLRAEGSEGRMGRAALFAAGLLVLAYGPVAFLNAKTLRHYYTLGPGLAFALALPASAMRRGAGSLVYGALLCGYFAACTTAEIEQCWVPQSQELQELKKALGTLRSLAPQDWVVIPETHLTRGTAPYFGIGGAPWDRYFAEYVTGVPELNFAREIVAEGGKLRFYHFYFMKDAGAAELEKLHVLAPESGGRYRARRYLAWEPEAGSFELLPLKGPGPRPEARRRSREELRALEAEIYFPKPFDHGNPRQPKY